MEAEHLSDEELAELIVEARTLRDAERQAAVLATKKFRATHELLTEMEGVQKERAREHLRRRQRRGPRFVYSQEYELPDSFVEAMRKHFTQN